jgi:hypothetical protein
MNVWQELAQEIINIPVDDPKRSRKIQAIVKRFNHGEKASVYHRVYLFNRDQLSRTRCKVLRDKMKLHRSMQKMSDDDVITWDD